MCTNTDILYTQCLEKRGCGFSVYLRHLKKYNDIWQADSTDYVENGLPDLHFVFTFPCEIDIFISETESSHANSNKCLKKKINKSCEISYQFTRNSRETMLKTSTICPNACPKSAMSLFPSGPYCFTRFTGVLRHHKVMWLRCSC